jgi:SAM-dependent methyltransferase
VGLGDDLDVVAVFNLIHHLPEERDRELVGMAREALRPGGCLVIGDSEKGAASDLLFYAWSHSRNFSRAEIARWLEDAGFEDVRVHPNERSPWRVVVVGRVPR